MKPTAVLRNDHEVLRSKLTLLEGLLPLERTAHFPLREVTYSITRRLRCHLEKEEHLFALLRSRRVPQSLALTSALLDEHQDQRLTTTLLLDLLLNGAASPIDPIALCASHLIDGLREHMAREEAEVFPLIDQAMGERQETEALQQMREIATRHYPEGEPQPRPSYVRAHEHLVIQHSSCRHVACVT